MISRNFTFEDQENFAQLSGDYNPAHLDEIATRRFQFGKPVAHGVHLLLWTLDCWLKDHYEYVKLRSLKVDFKKPVFLNENVHCFFYSHTDDRVSIEVSIEDSVIANIEVEWSTSRLFLDNKLCGKDPDRLNCKVLNAEKVTTVSGKLDLCVNEETSSKLFPVLTKKMPLQQLAELLAVTRLVGMECPGYHSVLSALDISFVDNPDALLELTYNVSEYDKRFSLLSINLRGPSLNGTVRAFFRPPPKSQKSIFCLRKKITNKEFKGQNALIIGGSRGLGEVAAKLLAAGGANVKITYYRGKEDALKIVDEIVSVGGYADCTPFNILDIENALSNKLIAETKITHLYYFATPSIFAIKYKKYFSSKLFKKFCKYYVTGFESTVNSLCAISPGITNIFYPSSIAIDELLPSLAEYTCAKVAGEILCNLLEKYHKGLSIYKPRLPRMATDQTASVLIHNSQDAAPVMLGHIRKFCDMKKKEVY
ncbi:MAG: hypothetical protein GY853_11565 [PVC group bacterium]|nr:hypothetical protein [PVC group bacterium]